MCVLFFVGFRDVFPEFLLHYKKLLEKRGGLCGVKLERMLRFRLQDFFLAVASL